MNQEKIVEKYLKPEFFKKDGDKTFLNTVLISELSAVQIYDKVIDKFKNDPEATRLKEFRMEHVSTSNELQSLLDTKGEHDIETNPGLWGDVASTIMSAATLVGPKGALHTLKKGEELVFKAYEEALKQDLSEDTKKYIQDILKPRQERHINSLNAMLKLQ